MKTTKTHDIEILRLERLIIDHLLEESERKLSLPVLNRLRYVDDEYGVSLALSLCPPKHDILIHEALYHDVSIWLNDKTRNISQRNRHHVINSSLLYLSMIGKELTGNPPARVIRSALRDAIREQYRNEVCTMRGETSVNTEIYEGIKKETRHHLAMLDMFKEWDEWNKISNNNQTTWENRSHLFSQVEEISNNNQ